MVHLPGFLLIEKFTLNGVDLLVLLAIMNTNTSTKHPIKHFVESNLWHLVQLVLRIRVENVKNLLLEICALSNLALKLADLLF